MTFRDACEEARTRADREGETVKVVFRPDMHGPLSKDGYVTMTDAEEELAKTFLAQTVIDRWRYEKTCYPRKGAPKQSERQMTREENLAKIKADKLQGQVLMRGFNWCEICGFKFHADDYENGKVPLDLDHIIPRSRGGGDDPANLQLLCSGFAGSRCHAVKHNQAEPTEQQYDHKPALAEPFSGC